MKIFVKNMVSPRCKMLVQTELDRLEVGYTKIELGEIELITTLTTKNKEALNEALTKAGLELLDDRKSVLVEKIKNLIIKMIHYSDELPAQNYSVYISTTLHHNYTYLANLFSEVEEITIEHFIIAHKIEKVKELLLYDEMSLTDISYKLHYSSLAHLSSQFKKVTGMTPTYFKNKTRRRKGLDNL